MFTLFNINQSNNNNLKRRREFITQIGSDRWPFCSLFSCIALLIPLMPVVSIQKTYQLSNKRRTELLSPLFKSVFLCSSISLEQALPFLKQKKSILVSSQATRSLDYQSHSRSPFSFSSSQGSISANITKNGLVQMKQRRTTTGSSYKRHSQQFT